MLKWSHYQELSKVLDSSSEYYKKLHSSRLNVIQSDVLDPFLGNPNFPAFSDEEKLSCVGKIVIDECIKVLDTFDAGKTPGDDGIPAEF